MFGKYGEKVPLLNKIPIYYHSIIIDFQFDFNNGSYFCIKAYGFLFNYEATAKLRFHLKKNKEFRHPKIWIEKECEDSLKEKVKNIRRTNEYKIIKNLYLKYQDQQSIPSKKVGEFKTKYV